LEYASVKGKDMLRIIAEIHVSDEREDEIVRHSGLRYKNLIRYIDTKIKAAFESDGLQAYVKDVKIEPRRERGLAQAEQPAKPVEIKKRGQKPLNRKA
jgi:hypothetical protein